VDFSDLLIKGRSSKGNIITKFPIRKIEFKSPGVSTLKPRKIWFDDAVQRLNVDERGELLGEFTAEDKLLIITQSGIAKTIAPTLNYHFEEDMIVLEKWNPKKPVSAIYFDGDKEKYFVKRFRVEYPEREDKFITEHPKSQLEIVATDFKPNAEVIFSKRSLDSIIVDFEEFIAVKGVKAIGNQLSTDKIKQVNLLEPKPYTPPVLKEMEVDDDTNAEEKDNQPTLF
jgi:topoisomerase-4 subunit A